MAVRNNPFKPIIKSIPAPLRNKYFITATVFIAWMIFFDKHSPFDVFGLIQKERQMATDKDYYTEQIEYVKEKREEFQLDPEKFGRENHYMKKSDEDVFIFEYED